MCHTDRTRPILRTVFFFAHFFGYNLNTMANHEGESKKEHTGAAAKVERIWYKISGFQVKMDISY